MLFNLNMLLKLLIFVCQLDIWREKPSAVAAAAAAFTASSHRSMFMLTSWWHLFDEKRNTDKNITFAAGAVLPEKDVVPSHVPYLLIGAGTASFSAYRSESPSSQVSLKNHVVLSLH